MQMPLPLKLKSLFRSTSRWFAETPERSLNHAYKAALKIREIEDRHFRGQPVAAGNADYGESVVTYFQTEVNSYLQKINLSLQTFKTSRFFLNLSEPEGGSAPTLPANRPPSDLDAAAILDKLRFIDAVRERYPKSREGSPPSLAPSHPALEGSDSPPTPQSDPGREMTSASRKSGVLPRSFMNTLNRIKQEIDPKTGDSEEAILRRYRTTRHNTATSIKFILLLIIVPLLTHQLTKTFFLVPIVERYFQQNEQIVFINRDLEEEAFAELKAFEETLRFRSLIGLAPKLPEEEIEGQLRDRAKELSEDYRLRGVNALANVFADFFSLAAFAVVIRISRREIETVKNFLDEILYTLSDSAKAFLIILFTDMFVGFHSPHGWEVILEGIARHFGLPENREFNFLFIATFPVILDTILKYWIFRYLNRISPSAVATYKNMNE
jgi:hypothetical protein